MKRNIKNISILLLSSVLFFSACSKVEEPPVVMIDSEDDIVSYSLVQVAYDDVVLTRKIDCKYSQTKDQEVSFDISGKYVDKVYVQEGDEVKKGDILCELSSESLEEAIERLEYNITRNELQMGYYDVNKDLDIQDLYVNWGLYGATAEGVQKSAESIKKNYERKKVLLNDTLEFDREELARLKKELASSRIYATMDGKVYDVMRRLEGSTTKAGTVIMTIVDSSDCLFETSTTEGKELFKEGEKVDMKISYTSASGDYVLLPYDIENWTDKMQFSVYTGPDNVTIEVGASGEISVIEDTRTHVLTLPKEVVHLVEDKAFVYTLTEDNIREIRYIEIGLKGDERIEILGGLSEGEKVVKK